MIIMLFVLILSMGLFTFNSASTVVEVDRLDAIEIQTFNEPITQYEGLQTGTQVKALIGTLITNTGYNDGFDDRLPDIEYVPNNGPDVDDSLLYIESDSINTHIDLMSQLKSKIANTHEYNVEIEYNNDNGLVEKIIIIY